MATKRNKVKFLEQDEFFKLFGKFIHESEKGYRTQKSGIRIKSQSVQNYTYTLKLIKKFCDETDFEIKLFLVNNLSPKELIKAKNYWQQFYLKFTEYLYKKEDHFDNYVGFTIKNLRVFMNYLTNELQLQTGNFHRNFHVPKEDIPIVALGPEQLNYLIYNDELNNKLPADLRITKDIFVFGCTVALRFSDLVELKSFNLIKKDNGYYIKVKSKKTNKETLIKLPDYAVSILKKHKPQKGYLLPQYSKGYFNIQLKRLAEFISDTEPMIKVRMRKGKPVMIYKDVKKKTHYTMADHITTHTMRRTAITTMLRLGMPEQVVRKISGHAANSREFYKYVAFSQTYIDNETDKVFEKLAEFS